MAKIFNRALLIAGEDRTVGTPSVRVLQYDRDGKVLMATGNTVPTDGDAGYAIGCLFIDNNAADDSILLVNEGTTTSADFNDIAPSASTSATAYDDIGDPDANSTIAFAGYTNTWTSTLDTGTVFTISDTDADLSADTILVDLKFTDDGDANGIFLRCLDNSGADVKFSIGADGAVTIAGNAEGTAALTLTAGDIVVTDGDVVLTAGDLSLNADNEQITLGAAGATDSYIRFSGSDLEFYDSTLGVVATLSQLANNTPT